MKLEKRVALVTGASRGIGKAIAMRLGAEGCLVIVNFLSNKGDADNVVYEIKSTGGMALSFQADISSEEEVNHMISRVTEAYGGVDILVNNARVDPYQGPQVNAGKTNLLESGDWWDKNVDVGLRSVFLLSGLVFNRMKEKGWGRIINVSSLQAQLGADEEQLIPYSAAKAGIGGLTKSFAKLGGPYGVTANAVSPGTIETDLLWQRISSEKAEAVRSTIPVKRFGKPNEVAEAVMFLVKCGFITGETININGGVYMP